MATVQRRRRGAHALEFALLMPVFLGIWMGIVEYCWLAYQFTSLSEAVAVGCRAGSLLDPGPAEVDSKKVIDAAKKTIDDEYSIRGAGCAGQCVASVALVSARPVRSLFCTMSAPYTSITGFVPTPTSLSSQAVVRLEYQRSAN